MSLRARWHTRRDAEGGFVTLLVALLGSSVLLGCAAIGVDTAQWYLVGERVQKAADAAALAGVPYLPQDFPSAVTRAKEVAARNGYDDASPDVEVDVSRGRLASQLVVTVSARTPATFGTMIGIDSAVVSRTATSDYQGPAPMGSPCNTFGNEPASGGGPSAPTPTGSALAFDHFSNCSSRPQFWATVEGPETDKVQGDQFQTVACAAANPATAGCNSGKNSEHEKHGYFFLVKVQPAAVNSPIQMQLYDPAYVEVGQSCSSSGTPSQSQLSTLTSALNPYVTLTDQAVRYSTAAATATGITGSPYCPGDSQPGTVLNHQMTTSFAMREQTDTQDPIQGAIIQGCVKQYTGTTTVPQAKSTTVNRKTVTTIPVLDSSNSSYNKQLAQVFHNWTTLCTFTPTRAGDYYLQVQTDVKPGGNAESNTNGNAAIVYDGNPKVGTDDPDCASSSSTQKCGGGDNSFSIRAVTQPGLESSVAVSGYDRMPIFANAPGASSTFNLIRVLPGAAGQYVSFSFFDAGDATGNGTVTIAPPTDATGSVLLTPFPGGCRAQGGNAGTNPITLPTCSASITNTKNNGQLETMTIPIPGDYTCNYASLGGCWYRVTISFAGATSVTDVTTWDASVVGDPVRLIG